MATPQLSPGILVREIDLTVGRAGNILDNVGAIAGPFSIGPVDYPVDISTENDLINVFGKPYSTDAQYEYWMSAASYLSYGGVLKVVRTSNEDFVNANALRDGSVPDPTLLIKNPDTYDPDPVQSPAYMFAAKNPGSWANGLKVAIIDDKADQILGISTSNVQAGYAVTTALNNVVSAGVGVTSLFNGYLKGIVTGVGKNQVDVKIVSIVDTNNNETKVTYAQRNQLRSFRPGNTVSISTSITGIATISTLATNSVLDWYDEQKIELSNTTLYWNSIAPKPITNEYVAERGGENDAMHVVVIDDAGTISGVKGNVLEKHLGLSKAVDAISRVNSPQKIWYKNYLALSSKYIYSGLDPSNNQTAEEPVYITSFESGFTPKPITNGQWGVNAQDVSFNAIGNVSYILKGGQDYGVSSGFNVKLGDIFNSYSLFSNRDEIKVDFLIMGPGFSTKAESQAKANYLISIAEQRRDCLAVISPHRDDVVNVPNSDDQTNNVIQFYSSLSGDGDQGGVRSSSYAVFDSGYKYTYDKFNNVFRYIPCNADVAGIMARTSRLAYPWFSPAGQQRGVLNDAIKLAYTPSKSQRDRLYPHRVNAILNQPGVGVLLYGDKTALGYSSAFDRINVRRLFLTIENALETTAQAQLFEVNDEITRASFINIVDPYLRDVQAKRGIYDYVIICDDTNNTPDIIDNNEFRADIYIKPVKAINYVTLTFVATRTGISFEEVAGRV